MSLIAVMAKRALLLPLFVSLSACGEFGSSESPNEPSAPLADAGPGGEVALATGFESTSSSCAGWMTIAGTTKHVPRAHKGNNACEICTTASGAGAMRQTVASDRPGRYEAALWARNPDATATAATGLTVELYANNDALYAKLGDAPVIDDFSEHRISLNVGKGGPVSITVSSSNTPGACIVVDDVTVTRTPL